MSGSITVELTAAVVGNPASQQCRTAVELAIRDSSGRIAVSSREGDARSLHAFQLAHATDIGVGPPCQLTPEQAGRILALACSLTDFDVLFSSLQPIRTNPPEFVARPSTPVVRAPEVTDTGAVRSLAVEDVLSIGLRETAAVVIRSSVVLNEAEVLNLAAKLLALRPFDRRSRTRRDANVIDALDAYGRAADATDLSACLQVLYVALEKAVNAEVPSSHRDPTGPSFDAAAAKLTGLAPTRVERARQLNDRLKHRRRNSSDTAKVGALMPALPEIVRDIKLGAGRAIKGRL